MLIRGPASPYDANNKTSLRAAIEDGNAIAGSHIINFTLIPAGEGEPPVPRTISLQKALDPLAKDFWIGGLGPELTIVQRAEVEATFPVFQIKPDVTVMISGLCITNGDAKGFLGGGGVLNEGNLTLANCWIFANRADVGGGVISVLGKMTIQECKIWGNEAPNGGNGGGVAILSADVKTRHDIIDSEIYANEAEGMGGGVYIQSWVHLENTTVTGNIAGGVGGPATSHGGGVANWGVFTMEDGKIELNDASGYGGGLYSQSDHPGTGLVGVAILDNHSDQKGGGFYVQKGWIHVGGSLLKNTATKGIPGGGWKHDPGMATGVTWGFDPGSQAVEVDP